MTVIVLLILAGVSLNAIIGDNGVITNSMNAKVKNGMAVLEEFLQEKYVENYDKVESQPSKILGLMKIPSVSLYFYKPTVGVLNYVVDSDGDALYLIDKSKLPKEIREQLVGGDAGNKTYSDYQSLNDVYGVTSDLKVYYCSNGKDTIYGLAKDNLDKDDFTREVFGTTSGKEYCDELVKLGKDNNGDGKISAEEAQSVKELTINENSSISSLDELYNLVSLQKLVIENKQLESLEGIENCPSLFYLYFNNSTIGDYSAMSGLGNRLTTLYFYNIDDTEFSKACEGIKDAKFSELETLAITGNTYFIIPTTILTNDLVVGTKCAKTISTLEPLSKLSSETKQAIRYMCINNNNLKDEDLGYISDFTNIYLLRAEYNSFKNDDIEYGLKSLDGLENMKKLTYLYASNNLLGKDCDELGGGENCLSSLEEKNKKNSGVTTGEGLYYVNLRNNADLKFVDCFESDIDIRFLYLSGCNSGMSVNKIASIIINCGQNYDLPCKFLNGKKYVWTDYFSLEEITAEKLESDLKNNGYITTLDLNGCKKEDITNEVLNEILKTMPKLQYLRLDDTNLSTIDFCRLKEDADYAYCPELIELDLRNTYVTDISDLNNLVESNSLYPSGRKMGTLRLSDSLTLDEDGNPKLVNLPKIQDVINNLDGKCLLLSNGRGGLVITSFNTMKLLEDCKDVKTIVSSQYNLRCKSDQVLDLSKLNLVSATCSGWEFVTKFGGHFSGRLYLDQSFPCVFEKGTIIDGSVTLINSLFSDKINGSHWRNFFKSCQICSKIYELNIRRCPSFKADYFYENDIQIFDGSTVERLKFSGESTYSSEFKTLISLDGFEKLIKVKNLSFENLLELSDFDALKQLTSLESLTIKYCDFSKLSDLEGMNSLNYLYIEKAKSLGDVEILNNFEELTELHLIDCGISSCEPFRNLNKLVILDLQNNTIGVSGDSLGILANLHTSKNGKLEKLYLKGNNGLKGIIENHEILKLVWKNNDVW